MDGRTDDGRTNGWTDERMDERMDGRTDGHIQLYLLLYAVRVLRCFEFEAFLRPSFNTDPMGSVTGKVSQRNLQLDSRLLFADDEASKQAHFFHLSRSIPWDPIGSQGS